jgi:hypothetical protein
MDATATPRDVAPAPLDRGTVRDVPPAPIDRGAVRDVPPAPIDRGAPPVDVGVPAHCAAGPLATPIEGCRPSTPPSTGDPRQDCVDRINQFRRECQCLPPLQRWIDGEACADSQAMLDQQTRTAHNGFRMRLCNSGSGQNECQDFRAKTPVFQGDSHAVGQAWDSEHLQGLAVELLRAVDEGTPGGELARALALDVLRVAPADSPPWHRAVAVLEGGPLRMRHAVELAGLVMDAAEVPGEGMTG